MSTVDAATRRPVLAPSGTARLTAARASGYPGHLEAFGALPLLGGPALLNELRASGLEGRGGAGFLAWRKLGAVPATARSRVPRAVVIGNGAEGEPLSSKDMTVLRLSPHLVIDGLLAVAAAIDAAAIYLYAAPSALEPVTHALAERSDGAAIELRPAAERFVAGEASAVVNALAGRRAVPSDRTVRLTTSGLGGRPTLVHNVETLAQIALIARFGSAWFRALGTPAEPGTRLVTLTRAMPAGGPAPWPTVLEIAGGTRIVDVLRFVGIDPAALSAVLVGGYHGAWVPASAFDLRLDREQLAVFGAGVGAGVLLALDARLCPLAVASSIATYLAGETAGQCGPCVNGLPAMAGLLRRIAAGESNRALPAEVGRLAALVSGRGSCHHPDGTARFVLSTLSVFAADVAAHFSGGCRKEHA